MLSGGLTSTPVHTGIYSSVSDDIDIGD